MNEPEIEQPKIGKKERKKPKSAPYKVKIGGRTYWQVNLEGELVRRPR